MKRDMNLVRAILLELEASNGNFSFEKLLSDEVDEQTVGYHVWLLKEGGYLVSCNIREQRDRLPKELPLYLTWRGHDFLDAARSETIWRKTLSLVGSKVGTATVDVLLTLLKQQVLGEFGLKIS